MSSPVKSRPIEEDFETENTIVLGIFIKYLRKNEWDSD